MSNIVTFYSYKGGVGRSMALANIALLLARRGLRVLAIDWDLEAPGLERYFSYFEISQNGPGLLRMFMQARDSGDADYTEFTSKINCETAHPITLLSSGREADELYTNNLEAFDWEAFFNASGGAFIEKLRDQWKADFDVTLIDSRTGLSDTGGICTIQLPDIVVGMFTANLQSLYGVRDVMRLAQEARQTLAYDRMPLSVFPLAARWGMQEFQETQVWLDRVAEATGEFFEDWLPKEIAPRDVIQAVKIPQFDYFSFGERLAVVEHGIADPVGMGFAYNKVASFIASDFKRLEALVGEHPALRAASEPTRRPESVVTAPVEEDYLYDVYFSYDSTMAEWVLEFTDRLKLHLGGVLGRPARTFIDVQELRAGDGWNAALSEALVRSKVLVAFVTTRYLGSKSAAREYEFFRARAVATRKPLIVPVLLRGNELNLPHAFVKSQWFDLRKLSSQPILQTKRSSELEVQLLRLAMLLEDMIVDAPEFDPQWKELARG